MKEQHAFALLLGIFPAQFLVAVVNLQLGEFTGRDGLDYLLNVAFDTQQHFFPELICKTRINISFEYEMIQVML